MIRTIGLLLLLISVSLSAFDWSWSYEANLSVDWRLHGETKYRAAQLEQKPAISATLFATDDMMLDAEYSERVWGWVRRGENNCSDDELDALPYRAWLRLGGDYWQARVGLQKLNFGPAKLLRGLQWFDQLDPRDPTNSTEGVWAFLFRYYFANNANLWGWVVKGENELQGQPFYPSQDETPEWGGRFECPIIHGTLGLTYHHREVDPVKTLHLEDPVCDSYAIDGRWDWRFGFWGEAVAHHIVEANTKRWLQSITLGGDYTIGVGNGVYVAAEMMNIYWRKEFFGGEAFERYLACTAKYSLGMLDDVTLVLTYDIENKLFFRYIDWRRAGDYTALDFSLSWDSSESKLIQDDAKDEITFQAMLSVDL